MEKSIKLIFKALLASMLVLPMLTSCYDDTAIWEEFDKIENRLDSLENSLNKQFQALNSLIDSKTTISACDKNSDGSYDVTLSNGVKFTVLPDGTKFSSLVSVMEVGGVKCWATYVNGEKLEEGDELVLHDGDTVRMSVSEFIFKIEAYEV